MEVATCGEVDIPMIAVPGGFSPQEYLALEHNNAIRHEYRQGLVYAMAGGSNSHSRLCINLKFEDYQQLRKPTALQIREH